MAFSHSPKIVTEGLVLCLDVADKNSYPGSGASWSDLSPHGNDGTLSAAAIGTDVPGVMDFNGSSEYVTMGDVLDMGTSDFTFEAWIKTDSDVSGTVFGKYAYNLGDELGYYFGMDHGGSFRVGMDTGSGGSNVTSLNSTSTIDGIGWCNIVAQFESDVMKLYLNGVLEAVLGGQSSDFSSLGNVDTSANFLVGALYNYGTSSFASFWNGYISNARIFNRALSTKEISQNFNAQRSRFGV